MLWAAVYGFEEWNDDYEFPIGLIASMMAFCISSI